MVFEENIICLGHMKHTSRIFGRRSQAVEGVKIPPIPDVQYWGYISFPLGGGFFYVLRD